MAKGNYSTQTVNENIKKFREKKQEIERIMDYPPFAQIEYNNENWDLDSATEVGKSFIKEFHKVLKTLQDALPEGAELDFSLIDPKIYAEPFQDLEKKFPEELETARLYQKRFGDNWELACKSFAKPDFTND